jgi:2-polyprenyl-3-methyl-5-hydroxy-6-metoxy-1,4-benzoquinol methylase
MQGPRRSIKVSQKTKYLTTCIRKSIARQGFSCPSCGGSRSSVVSRKYLVTALRRCEACRLLFRTPTTTPEENASFYQEEYTQGFTTDVPSDAALAEYLKNGFKGGEKDYSTYIGVLAAAGAKKGDRLFDFGCSWGYGSWQLAEYGFNVDSFEISEPRGNFARTKLGVKVHSTLRSVQGPFDVFFSAHVLEHVPSVKGSIEFAMSILKPKGLFVAFTPNGSAAFRNANARAWNQLWGLVHPNFLDDEFYLCAFPKQSLLLSSNPYSLTEIEKWRNADSSRTTCPLDEGELLVLVKK